MTDLGNRPDVLMRFFGEARIETVLENAKEEFPLQDGTGLEAAIRILNSVCTTNGGYFNDDDAEAVALLIRRAHKVEIKAHGELLGESPTLRRRASARIT